MRTYKYCAHDGLGNTYRGTAKAGNAKRLSDLLSSEGLFLTDYKETLWSRLRFLIMSGDYKNVVMIAVIIALLFSAPVGTFSFVDNILPNIKSALLDMREKATIRLPRSIPLLPAPPLSEQETKNTAELVYKKVSPSVVVVRHREGQGSGVVVAPSLIATNRHVIEGGGRSTKVFHLGNEYDVHAADCDPVYDLCLLYLPGLDLPPVNRGSYKELRGGQRVYTVGAPSGYELTMTEGLISRLEPNGDFPWIQSTAPASPGSSGGGLFDTQGRLVGITTRAGEDGVSYISVSVVADLIPLVSQRQRTMNVVYKEVKRGQELPANFGLKSLKKAIEKKKREAETKKQAYQKCENKVRQEQMAAQRRIEHYQKRVQYYRGRGDLAGHNRMVAQYNKAVEAAKKKRGSCTTPFTIYERAQHELFAQVQRYNDLISRSAPGGK